MVAVKRNYNEGRVESKRFGVCGKGGKKSSKPYPYFPLIPLNKSDSANTTRMTAKALSDTSGGLKM